MSAAVARVDVDSANPGHFFACCGLLEVAHRLLDSAEGWFEDGRFYLSSAGPLVLSDLVTPLAATALQQVDPGDDYASPMAMDAPIGMLLDWWADRRSVGARLKVWAGSMRSLRIARAMQNALQHPQFHGEDILNQSKVVFDPLEPTKKVEPYYFDARRGSNAQSLDIGFAPDALNMVTAAYPAVEFLCLLGLQRVRPAPTDAPRVFEYCTWSSPCAAAIAPAAACGLLPGVSSQRYRFENGFRTDQRKHKAFQPAVHIGVL
ncbi:MAG: hypothetical protein ACF8R7_15905 [Phycisphaerales bacterium JB039]